MGRHQRQKHCRDCGRKTLHEKQNFSGGMGCLLTILTAGLFIPIWGFLMLRDSCQKWRCQLCGRGRSF